MCCPESSHFAVPMSGIWDHTSSLCVLIFIPAFAGMFPMVLSCLFYECAVIKCVFLVLTILLLGFVGASCLNMAFDPWQSPCEIRHFLYVIEQAAMGVQKKAWMETHLHTGELWMLWIGWNAENLISLIAGRLSQDGQAGTLLPFAFRQLISERSHYLSHLSFGTDTSLCLFIVHQVWKKFKAAYVF